MTKTFVWNGTEYSDEELKERFDSLGKKENGIKSVEHVGILSCYMIEINNA